MTNASIPSEVRSKRFPAFVFHIWKLIVLFSVVPIACAADPELSAASNVAVGQTGPSFHGPTIDRVQLGIVGLWKIGYPTQAQVTVSAGDEDLNGSIEIETVDSDGVGVIYQTDCRIEGGKVKDVALITRHGRATRPIYVRVVDKNGQRIVQRLISDQERGETLPVSQPWIVGIGLEMELEQAALRSAKGLLSSYSTCEINNPSKLPRFSKGYQGVNLLVISTRDWSILQRLDVEQQRAIVEWVREGGSTLVWLGENANRIAELPWLASLVPAQVQGIAQLVDPSVLESFLSSQKRLGKLTCGRLVSKQAIVDLTMQSTDHQKLPVLIRSALGFGKVQVFAADLDSSPLREWPDRKLLLERLLLEHWDAQRDTRSRALDTSDYLGYDDLSGQTRAALDTFNDVRSGSLTLLATILSVLVALLGPFDYFVVSKAWQRPAWTWFSLGLWSISALVGVTLLARAWKPQSHAINSIELLDYDYSSAVLRGRAFANHYAGRAGLFDFSASARDVFLKPNAPSESNPSDTSEFSTRTQLSWSGQPGYGLGGFDSSVRTDLGFPEYQVRQNSDLKLLQDNRSSNCDAADLIDVGIAYSGSKSIRADWTQNLNLTNGEETHLSATGVSESLQGSWINPMSEDLLDGWLLYRGWIYTMPSRVRSGSVYQISASDTPKDLGRKLQRRQVAKDSDSSVPWDPTDRTNFGRIVEMLTLHRAAGGSGYTGLNHRYWNDLDLSQHLRLNRAIVFGRLAKPLVDWTATASDKPIDVRDGNRAAFVRFVIPVDLANP